MKRCSISTLLVVALFNFTISANAATYLMAPNSLGDYEFPPNQPVTVSNPLFFSIEARCKMINKQQDVILKFSMLKKSGILQNLRSGEVYHLSTGQSAKTSVLNNDVIEIKAKGFAKVEFINTGTHTINAKCNM